MAGVEEAMDVGTGKAEVAIDTSRSQACASVDSGSIDTCQSESCGSENLRSIDSPEKQPCDYKNSGAIDTSESQSCSSVDLRSIDNSQDQSCGSGNRRSIATSPSLEAKSSSHPPKKASVDIPVDADGCAENPDAYRLWQPKKMEGEVLSAEEWQERWSRLREKLSMKKK